MEKYIRSLFPEILFIILTNVIFAGFPLMLVEGDYLLYSEANRYLFGAGNIKVKIKDMIITGEYLFFDIKSFKGKIVGKVSLNQEKDIYDEIIFDPFSEKFTKLAFKEKIVVMGKKKNIFPPPEKTLKDLKNSAIYYELRKAEIFKSKKIVGYTVIPYLMGVPSFPVKKLLLKKGEIFEKSTIFLKSIKYDDFYGLSFTPSFIIRSKGVNGEFDFRFFERELFGVSGKDRGLNISGNTSFKLKNQKALDLTGFYFSDSNSYNLNFSHKNSIGPLSFSLNQNISKVAAENTTYNLEADFRANRIKYISPFLNINYDYKKSYSYLIGTPLKILKNTELFFVYSRKKTKGDFASDTSSFRSSLNFSSSLIELNSNFNLKKDFIEDSLKKDFTLNFSTPDLIILKNINFNLSPFYSFSSYPLGKEMYKKNSFGFNFSVNSAGIKLPLGFSLYPNFMIYQNWERDRDSKTNFNYFFNVQKKAGIFNFTLNYSLSSSYKTDGFWTEGYNLSGINLRVGVKSEDSYNIYLNFFFNDSNTLENISSKLEIRFFTDWRIFSFSIYNNKNKELRTFEVFLEKIIKNSFKIQGGYSLLLKRFFVKLITF